MSCFRIGDPAGRFKIYSGEGAALTNGRWHVKGQEVIYCSQHYATALLEKLAHYNGLMPSGQHFIKITIPVGVSYEVVTKDTLPGWEAPDSQAARSYGMKWINECRTAILIVPSLPAIEENNILINPAHSDFSKIKPGLEKQIRWDKRLFG